MRRRIVLSWIGVALATSCPLAAHATTRRMFVTTEMGSGDLSTWPSSGGLDGIAGADNVCRTLATNAGLPRGSTFVAWMSDATSDAYCRVHGFTGKRTANCGKPLLPTSAGPWVRTDGRPFGGPIPEVLDGSPDGGAVLAPPSVDQNGNAVAVGIQILTDTDTSGTWISGFDCSNWSSSSGNAVIGETGGGSGWWTYTGSSSCDTGRRLLCFDPGTGVPLPAYSSWGRTVFVTSATGNGDLSTWGQSGGTGGLAGGDAICRKLATNAGLPNPHSFKAWLSSSTTDAASRFQNDGPWMRLDGIRVADGLADLVDGKLQAAIDETEQETYIGNPSVYPWYAWTGTQENGQHATDLCSNWTSSSSGALGDHGDVPLAGLGWSFGYWDSCDTAKRLYCLSDLPLIFGDGFEGGDESNWALTTP